jgi:hypothetical membrane protein
MRLVGITGLCVVLLHTASLSYAAAADSRFFDPYHAVSDMGIAGQPNAAMVNALVFCGTGLLVAMFAAGLAVIVRPRPHAISGAIALFLGGLAYAAAGVFPFPASEHMTAVAAAAVLLASGIALLGVGLARYYDVPVLRPVSGVVAGVIALHLFLLPLNVPAPGYVSKTAFLLAVWWFLGVSCVLLRGSYAESGPRSAASLSSRPAHDVRSE